MDEQQPARLDWTQIPLHPFFFAAHPILFLYASNAGQLAAGELWRPLWFSLASTAVAYAWLRLALREFARAALVLTVVVFLFFQQGLLSQIWYRAMKLDVLFAWALLVVALTVMVLRRRTTLTHWTRFLNLTGAFLLAMALSEIVAYQVFGIRGERLVTAHLAQATPPTALAPARGYAPDIYYIILDGYGRADVLADLYGKDTNRLTEYLSRKGFYVAPRARSNYGQTMPSLASSLNMEYLDYLSEDKGVLPQDRRPLARMVRDNQVTKILRSLGYTIVLYPSVYLTKGSFRADAVMADPKDDKAGVFEVSVAEMTPLPALAERLKEHASVLRFFLDEPDVHRMRTIYSLDHLGDLPDHQKPVFVFAHVLCPHPPFIFNRMGATRVPGELQADGTTAGEVADNGYYRAGYEDQVTYLNIKVREIVERILAHSKRPPIIILQGDHGPGSRLVFGRDPGAMTSVDLRERMSILNAYYLPAGGEQALYPTITPVNTFRSLFNYYFGAKYPRLADRSFFSTWMTPYRYIEYAPGESAPRTPAR